MSKIKRIEVKIPYQPDRRLGDAYNRAMAYAETEWVLLLDWDLFACNPYWYDICLSALGQVGSDAGWITCCTNRIGNPGQKVPGAPVSHDIMEHIKFAKRLYKELGDNVVPIKGALSGFFILTNKTAWQAVGGFTERRGLNGIDNYYSRDLCKAGYKLYTIPGLYYYHIYKQKSLIKWGAKPK